MYLADVQHEKQLADTFAASSVMPKCALDEERMVALKLHSISRYSTSHRQCKMHFSSKPVKGSTCTSQITELKALFCKFPQIYVILHLN